MGGYRFFFRYGLPVKTLQEDLPNHHEVLLFQGAGTERHGNGRGVISDNNRDYNRLYQV